MSVELLHVDVLMGGDIKKRSGELRDLFAASYGEDYRGDEKLFKKLDEAESAVILQDEGRRH